MERIKFAYLADCHIGGWRDEKLRDIGIKSFSKAVDLCIDEKVDFVVIAGDFFNTSVPGIEGLKEAAKKLRELKMNEIPVYLIAGSHDFSPSGKTILDVLEQAGLCINVAKGKVVDSRLQLNFTVDRKTGAKLTGLPGKKGMLEKQYYASLLNDNLESEDGFKIFLFHTAVSEVKKQELEKMDSVSVSFFPKKFNYYAGGHVHIVDTSEIGEYKNIVYPGPTFPNNFSELEKLNAGGLYIVEAVKKNSAWDVSKKFCPIKLVDVNSIKIDFEGKTPAEIRNELLRKIEGKKFTNTISLIRLFGKIREGKITDINLNEAFSLLYEKEAYFVMKNTYSLSSPEFEEIKFDTSKFEDIEEAIVGEHAGKINISPAVNENEKNDIEKKEFIKSLFSILSREKLEGERNQDFEKRLCAEIRESLDL